MAQAHQVCCCQQGAVCYRVVLCDCPAGSFSRGLSNLLETPATPIGTNFARQAGLALRAGTAVVCDSGAGLPGGLEPGNTYIVTIPPGDPDGDGVLGELCYTVTTEIVDRGFDLGSSDITTENAQITECGNPDCCEQREEDIEVFVLNWCGPCEVGDNVPTELVTLYIAADELPQGSCDVVRVDLSLFFPNLTIDGNLFCYEVIRPAIFVPPDTELVRAFGCFPVCESQLPDDSGCCVTPAEPPTDCQECDQAGCPSVAVLVTPALTGLCCTHDGIVFPPQANCDDNGCPCNVNYSNDECPVVSTLTYPGCGGVLSSVVPDQPPLYDGKYDLNDNNVLGCEFLNEFDVRCQTCQGWGGCGPTTCSDNNLHPPLTRRWRLRVQFMGEFTKLGEPTACPQGAYRWCRFTTQAQPPSGGSGKVVVQGTCLPANAVTLVVV